MWHWIVTGHVEDGEDVTRYVTAGTATQAERVFKRWLADPEDPDLRVLVTLIVQLKERPIAFFTENGIEDAPTPLTQ